LSSPAPDSSPRVSFLVYSCCEPGAMDKSIMISHQGGDIIHWTDMRFIVNPEDGTDTKKPCCSYSGTVDSSNTTTTGDAFDETNKTPFFKTGDTLKIVTPQEPKRLIIYKTIGTNRTILDTEFSCYPCNP